MLPWKLQKWVTMSTVGSVGSVRLGSLCSHVARISGSSNLFTVVRSLYSGLIYGPKVFDDPKRLIFKLYYQISPPSSHFASKKRSDQIPAGGSYFCSVLLN